LILCLKCKRMWPQGTLWCGTCRSRLGARECEDEHTTPLKSTCCTTCGSTRLSPGVPALNLRPLTWLLLASLALCAFPVFAGAASAASKQVFDVVIQALVSLGFISVMVCLLFPKSGAPLMGKVWQTLFGVALSLVQGIARLVLRLLQTKPADPPGKSKHK
jgi:hypothetical protein